MTQSIARHLLVLCLVLGTVLPKASAVLFEIIPGFQSIVICTGTDLVTLQIGPDGAPVKTPTDQHDVCAVEDPLRLAERTIPFWVRSTQNHALAFSVIANIDAPRPIFTIKSPSHAPPVSV